MRVMRFRPCIDIHEGRVKQIVGGTLQSSSSVEVNFETETDASHFASMYAQDNLPGGHVIMLGKSPSNEAQARSALGAYPKGLHVGGGINPSNAGRFLDYGASHVIVTSYVFQGGEIIWDRVHEMRDEVGKDRLVLDVSCRKKTGVDGTDEYFACTDRWSKWTDFKISDRNIGMLSEHCDEILIHAVDVEGLKQGLDLNLIYQLSQWAFCPITYAGGVSSIEHLNQAKDAGRGLIDVTIGSALDIFGGSFPYADAVKWQRECEQNK